MNRLNNPYLFIVLGPLVGFLTLVGFSVDPDLISIPGRLLIFGALAYIGVRYVGRAPVLAWRGDMSLAARNIIGWAMAISAMMLQQGYGLVYIAYDRPDWLSSLYWSPSFTVLMLVGLSLVMSSVPRVWPFGGHGRSGFGMLTSFLIAILSAGTLFFIEHLPVAWKLLMTLMAGLTHAV